MKCDGKHPNVAGNRVCMGDLRISFSEELSQLQENLNRVETLLDMINYDSSYDSSKRDELLAHSVLDEVYKSKTKKAPSSGIREVSFNEDDDVEEIEEKPLQNQEELKTNNTRTLILDDGSKVSVLENILDNEIERGIRNHISGNTVLSNILSESVPVESDIDTYEIEDRTSEIVSFVDEQGNLIAMNNNRIVINTDLHLGDANIIQQVRTQNG